MKFSIIFILIIRYVAIIKSSRRKQYKPFSKAGSFAGIALDFISLIFGMQIIAILFFHRLFRISDAISIPIL